MRRRGDKILLTMSMLAMWTFQVNLEEFFGLEIILSYLVEVQSILRKFRLKHAIGAFLRKLVDFQIIRLNFDQFYELSEIAS